MRRLLIITGLKSRMSTVTEMSEFMHLVQDITFTDMPDDIVWRWIADGAYSARSAYAIQFKGSYCPFEAHAVWRAQTEGKHRFFVWLLLQSKILTVDRLMARNRPCNPLCSLCQGAPETVEHLCLHCPFALQVWQFVHKWANNLVPLPSMNVDLQDWWRLSLKTVNKAKRRGSAAVLIYIAWNLWKEKNRHIF